MQILENESLKKYTTIKIGGNAKHLYIPESIDDLVNLMERIKNDKYYIIGGGSNILMNDQKTYENVICLTAMDNNIKSLGNGTYYVGASVRVQELINHINKDGFCGIEYLYSVPALIGGAIVMNAGRGRGHGLSISDFIEEVHIWDGGSIKVVKNDKCGFEYRKSNFKNSKVIVLGGKFTFDKIINDGSRMTKQDRINYSKKVQDYSGPSFGSVFCQHDRKIMQIVRILSPGFKNGISFSNKTSNWLTNRGEGTYLQAVSLINRVKRYHKIIGRKAVPEVIIWE
ncbi:hypothetical protein BEP19_12850 [Ammoniphilus oxalaticus]|uniref:UDP-N-acetylenolpyruvoylglucosamine reductase n=1 Tax=Ammoniphilus oxalaticus TaxID=66863 RepID=A0A419SH51_9BACL|nr:FAD-binding protein [Ammoniphilus oxalaticus]RKD23107.1 hypothetical protein BEP19_12850 [Ammoniphilus oxalaticus]